MGEGVLLQRRQQQVPSIPTHTLFLALKQSTVLLRFCWKLKGEGNGTPLQYSCLENPMDGETWWAAVHGVAKSWAQLLRSESQSAHSTPRALITCNSILPWSPRNSAGVVSLRVAISPQSSLVQVLSSWGPYPFPTKVWFLLKGSNKK